MRTSLLANGVLAALFAADCAVCTAPLDEPLSGCICASCWRAVRRIAGPVCDACGEPLSSTAESCAPCRSTPSRIDRARAAGEYDGALRDIVHALKYSGRRSAARPLARLMRECGATLLSHADCVVPVPLHWRREHARGFNQARELARHLGLPLIEPLARRRQTRPQVELAAARRRSNVAHAFRLRRRWRRSQRLRGLSIALVDDVRTTGATLEACAAVLRDAGAGVVVALTAARVSAGSIRKA